ncbi:MAG: hypothetical protein EO766_11870 [Hydrotalea sp. AMD]|uniref:hypothetical protein n=1 Tax=Hydrotalea sp. AMD TaxID=2501297 RepID=UPI0010259221|nr:hypothetical protein [Hydrotalea sp. AMD]RWZ87218.1 MAG: hypothetical protein EO766_11870 [Hydrotalea sp. AMD]
MFSQESLVRTPIIGLRVKLRNHLRRLNFVGKFSVVHHRTKGLIVSYKTEQDLPDVTEFNGYPVRYRKE